ncbi:uncharacterized protein CC84DRAFT_1161957 [Paraphaeosphaeria sporulosa]|uniref:Uncharacterized protein n=1 Tax=Paraphaeosphaeria sporulosa TaxID=1460663 RepID=A0A177CM75_9PLEO|nr:uncharacterized protein CC84DRAFT_1161957 [Paraphaeosphaeria sporulosa]OAG07909.1 hypothetical protein CC84DRAFT_1161957 [Paraphaeosphaeria sporulosa]
MQPQDHRPGTALTLNRMSHTPIFKKQYVSLTSNPLPAILIPYVSPMKAPALLTLLYFLALCEGRGDPSKVP